MHPKSVLLVAVLLSCGCRVLNHPLFNNHNCPMPQIVLAAPFAAQPGVEQWVGTQQPSQIVMQPIPPVVAQTPSGAVQLVPAPTPTVAGVPTTAPGTAPASPSPPNPGFPVAEAKYEESPTVIETLLTLREKLEGLQKDNVELKEQLQQSQQQTVERTQQNEEAANSIAAELATVKEQLESWKTDVTELRGRVRDQQTRHEQTLIDVEKEISDMIHQYTTKPVGTEE